MEVTAGREAEEESSEAFMEIEAGPGPLARATILHLIKEIIGFILFMHRQIPIILQHLELEFHSLKEECKNLEAVQTQTQVRASSRRQHAGQVREVKQKIKNLEKLMTNVSDVLAAVEQAFKEVYMISRVDFVLGGSLIRPLHVYELHFSHTLVLSKDSTYGATSKSAEMLSRKAIRALLSNGAGSVSYAGPLKLFLLVRAPAILSLTQNFLPNRGHKYSRKVIPYRLQVKAWNHKQDILIVDQSSHDCHSTGSQDSSTHDIIWFQCKHIIRGLPSEVPIEE